MTLRRRQILDFIRVRIEVENLPPTVREIASEFRISAPTALEHLRALERDGAIRRAPGRARSIELVDQEPLHGRAVPILGRISAGLPLFAEENVEGRLLVDEQQVHGRELFALRVEGDSMTGAGIFDGDLVIARKQDQAEDGEIVVVRIASEMTVKRLRRLGRRSELHPENPTYRPIQVRDEDARIQGKVVAVQRTIS